MNRIKVFFFTLMLLGILISLKKGHSVAFGEEKNQTKPVKIQPAQLRFFENQIRPLLVKRCQSCHNEKKQEGDVRLDQYQFLIKGNESGAVVVPRHPQKSRMMDVIQHTADDSQMPPKNKLEQKEIDLLTKWVKMGAPWTPEKENRQSKVGVDFRQFDFAKARKEHWSYRPVKQPLLPVVKNKKMARTPIDRFVQYRLETKGLSLSPQVDKQTLIRRVTFDLTGLPPTYQEVEEFVNNQSSDAYTKLVDRLLASPQYGERWGRHWLDVARYGDTKGYVPAGEDLNYPYAYTYRDYVIRAFNEDLPYDQFIIEQLAADLMDRKGDDRKLAALGFLTVGERFIRKENEIINDRIDLVSRGLLGMTAACARCHDHKFDPIPTEDYYSLYGLFASSQEPLKLPLISQPKQTAGYLAYQKELKKREAAYTKYLNGICKALRKESRETVGYYLSDVVLRKEKKRVPRKKAKVEINRLVLGRWIRFIRRHTNNSDPVFTIWHQFNRMKGTHFERDAKAFINRNFDAIKRPQSKAPLNKLVMQVFIKSPPKSMLDVAKTYGKLLAKINQQWLQYQQKNKLAVQLPHHNAEELRQVLYGKNSPIMFLTSEAVPRSFFKKRKDQLRKLERSILTLQRTSPDSPPRAMVLYDKKEPVTPHVFIRGNALRLGKEVPRRFFQLLSNKKDASFKNGSGRLELAKAIVNKKNPLTARVFVNRVWMHHFGKGLVQTPSDFGTQGALPSHPKLLDYLANDFMKNGWSIKQLHRQILQSAVYQQSGKDHLTGYKVDPANKLLWKKPVRRLEFEAMRDSILAATGILDLTMNGRPFNLEKRPFQTRRTIYGKIDRYDLPSLLQNFNFANPDASAAKRPKIIVPQQALFSMNNIFMIEMAKKITTHPELLQAKTEREKIIAIYRRIFSRNPNNEEVQWGEKYLAEQKIEYQRDKSIKRKKGEPNPLTPWAQYAQVLFMTNEFMYID
ncbi:hypothetical protein MNBD_PLANCTO02-1824 [hydrothermal vent metagenome]|uniref:Cytochrome c domain-containing protein n=1 Tax=hydrothermal vent metagenome TaxID=652676 RepID=A0A3B1E2W9_9ZZZZ